MNDATCPGCSAPSDLPRCRSCGAARAPGGLRVRRVVSQNPHGRLYLAEDEQGRPLALKELVFALVPDASVVEVFEREAGLLRQLSHPGIPKFLRSFSEGEGVQLRLYLAQEFVEGTSLVEWTRQGCSEAKALDVARQVLPILAYLHGCSPRVLHRDLKPANLIARPGGALALVDFGAAREAARGQTHRATLVGTFGYMPLEQLGGTVDERADLYALGATLIHLLSGKPPESLLEPGMRLAFEGAVRVTPKTGRWLRRLVALRREDRFGSAEEALAALDAPEPLPAGPKTALHVTPRTCGTVEIVWRKPGTWQRFLAPAVVADAMSVGAMAHLITYGMKDLTELAIVAPLTAAAALLTGAFVAGLVQRVTVTIERDSLRVGRKHLPRALVRRVRVEQMGAGAVHFRIAADLYSGGTHAVLEGLPEAEARALTGLIVKTWELAK